MIRKSPFPGMDPYLEQNPQWQSFHGWFIRKLAEQALPNARDAGLWIDVERSVYQREPTGQLVLVGEPDVFAGSEFSVSSWGDSSSGGTAVALAEPQAVHEVVLDPELAETYKQDYLVVREADRFRRVLAVVELLSFANKVGSYAPTYREKRMRFLTSYTHFMEIDLLRAGENPSRTLFPELAPTPYFIFVARKHGMGRHEEGFPQRLQDPLPVIGLPVGPGRPDLPLDLAAAFASAYDLSVHLGTINYGEAPVPAPALGEFDQQWVQSICSAVTKAS